MKLQAERLYITHFTLDMAESVHLNSLDADNRRYVPDEVFETVAIAEKVIKSLISLYNENGKPKVYPILLNDGQQIGHVQAAPIKNGWEIGYHVGGKYIGQGYATEAVKAFLPFILEQLGIDEIVGICHAKNTPSYKVMEKCGFSLEYEGIGFYQWKIKKIRRYRYRKQG